MEDKASMNIRENLINSEQYHFIEIPSKWDNHRLLKLESITSLNYSIKLIEDNQIYLGLTDSPLIFLNDFKEIDDQIKPDFLIFASRHRSETGRKAFLTHVTGNWTSKSDFGGEPRHLSIASALLVKAGFHSLKQQLNIPIFNEFSDFSLDIEVTHHGPTTLNKPLLFMELGSSEKEWRIKKAGKLVANSIMGTISEYLILKNAPQIKIGIGFGGTHYAPQFRKLIDQKNIALSFICPKYYIQELNKEMIALMIENTIEKIDYFIIDWKGTNSDDKKHLLALLEGFDLPIKKTKEF
jgi:D-aminoacyl-tRNA deacylase